MLELLAAYLGRETTEAEESELRQRLSYVSDIAHRLELVRTALAAGSWRGNNVEHRLVQVLQRGSVQKPPEKSRETPSETGFDAERLPVRAVLESTRVSTSRFGFGRVQRIAGIAIAVLLVLFATVSGWFASRSHVSPQGLSTLGTAYRQYTTQAGQRAVVELADGTRVTLNVASTLQVPRDFGVTNRTVRLTGQAVFDVAHATEHPFAVDARGARVAVLGTSFGVRAYTPEVRVAVQTGRVAVAACIRGDASRCEDVGTRTVLTENQVAVVTPYTPIHLVSDINVENELAFTSGVLALSGAPLSAIVDDLDRWYDVDVRFADPAVGRLVLVGALPSGSPENLVHALEITLKLRVERVGRVITVYPGEREPQRRVVIGQ